MAVEIEVPFAVASVVVDFVGSLCRNPTDTMFLWGCGGLEHELGGRNVDCPSMRRSLCRVQYRAGAHRPAAQQSSQPGSSVEESTKRKILRYVLDDHSQWSQHQVPKPNEPGSQKGGYCCRGFLVDRQFLTPSRIAAKRKSAEYPTTMDHFPGNCSPSSRSQRHQKSRRQPTTAL